MTTKDQIEKEAVCRKEAMVTKIEKVKKGNNRIKKTETSESRNDREKMGTSHKPDKASWSWSWSSVLVPVVLLVLMWVMTRVGSPLSWMSPGLRRGSSGADFTPDIVEGALFPYGVYALQGKRPYMEDRHHVRAELKGDAKATLYGVYDGHGGDAAAHADRDVRRF